MLYVLIPSGSRKQYAYQTIWAQVLQINSQGFENNEVERNISDFIILLGSSNSISLLAK